MNELHCPYCNRVAKNPNSHRNHERLCKLNPNRDLASAFRDYDKSKCGWSRGLTKETNERVARKAEALHTYYSGGRKGSFFGRHHSPETKEKLSRIQSFLIEEKGHGGFLDVKYYKISNIEGVEYSVRGTWELELAKHLNARKILWERKHYLSYIDDKGSNKTYVPDFYLPETKEYWEVKGYFSPKDKHKLALVEEQNGLQVKVLQFEELKALGLPITKQGKSVVDYQPHKLSSEGSNPSPAKRDANA